MSWLKNDSSAHFRNGICLNFNFIDNVQVHVPLYFPSPLRMSADSLLWSVTALFSCCSEFFLQLSVSFKWWSRQHRLGDSFTVYDQSTEWGYNKACVNVIAKWTANWYSSNWFVSIVVAFSRSLCGGIKEFSFNQLETSYSYHYSEEAASSKKDEPSKY